MKVYQKSWFIILMFVLFWTAPIGIYLMWKHKKDWSKKAKIISSAVFASLFILLIFAFANYDGETTKTNEMTPTLSENNPVDITNETSTKNDYIKSETDPKEIRDISKNVEVTDIDEQKEPTTENRASNTTATTRHEPDTSAATAEHSAPATKVAETTKKAADESVPIKVNTNLVFRRNETAQISITGKPNTIYDLTVYYSSGASTAEGTGKKQSDSNGNVTWTWHIGGRTNPGIYHLTISDGNETTRQEFSVIDSD